MISSDSNSIYEKINALDISDKMKTKMRLVHDNLKKTKLGMPEYDMKGKSPIAFFSIWAFLFNILYYLAKGMWRKAISLLVLSCGLIFIFGCAEELLGIVMPEYVYHIITLIPAVISMQSAYYDIYRSKVLEQKFWW